MKYSYSKDIGLSFEEADKVDGLLNAAYESIN